ncbi:hypothetical protein AS034_17660 [[Bacillus] enclensis]|uniref:Uncharacterized conserved protein, DUF302 family n=1 Tax=[Bacillus] enclensis TaxID=1402860 RepID=A0A0V8HBF8_9BACI|nr:DUF302 domain-containing protein [[Bacillus] enclensis]OAT81522.1 hypothetical protein A6P54_12150 [Bacillus sp. MKU004]QTC40245.1 DUF302 domain-containing protein [Bacillus sp. V3]QWC22365.1 DUF302 domain-containing protein [Bacillus haikouensis]KSU59858.1 hypothetical protein AS034_17660 [[Bacillus] enclensis]MBH9965963.1 DUF302 domain-containing protein [[Bacillus] enclensis]
MFHYTKEVSMSVKEASEKVEASLKEESFGVLWNLDLAGKLEEKGLDFNEEVVILEVCNPKEAKKVLEQSMLVSYFLPCKISIYTENGTTKVGMAKPSKLIELVDNEELKNIALDIEERLIACIEKV